MNFDNLIESALKGSIMIIVMWAIAMATERSVELMLLSAIFGCVVYISVMIEKGK